MGGKPTGRFFYGKVPSDLIVEELGIKELLPAYLDPTLQPEDLITGVDFASAGAGYDPLTSEIVVYLLPLFVLCVFMGMYKTNMKSCS
ncbi:GDSL esterase/lipase EXL1-like [Capsicum galapagoense]